MVMQRFDLAHFASEDHASGDNHGEQRPTAAKTIGTVPDAHLERPGTSVTPVLRHEGQGRATMG
jgi:hypothetical protein